MRNFPLVNLTEYRSKQSIYLYSPRRSVYTTTHLSPTDYQCKCLHWPITRCHLHPLINIHHNTPDGLPCTRNKLTPIGNTYISIRCKSNFPNTVVTFVRRTAGSRSAFHSAIRRRFHQYWNVFFKFLISKYCFVFYSIFVITLHWVHSH